jgi:sugar/nucleoside kinase (ribokinase family)
VQEKAKFLALNCQTNSNNYGYNIINRQYQRADSFSLDEAEIRLACGSRQPEFHEELSNLKSQFSSKYAWLTRGAVETIGLDETGSSYKCPPLENEVVDPVGAGDAFCAISFMAAALGLPIDISTYLGQMAGAQAVKIIGNTDAIQKGSFLKAAQTMINF